MIAISEILKKKIIRDIVFYNVQVNCQGVLSICFEMTLKPKLFQNILNVKTGKFM